MPKSVSTKENEPTVKRGAESKPIPVTLTTEAGTATLVVPPRNKWKALAHKGLTESGDVLGWASKTLSPDDYAKLIDLDPNFDELGEFFQDFIQKLGVELPN